MSYSHISILKSGVYHSYREIGFLFGYRVKDMHYIKANLIQIIFMLIALGLLAYGYFSDKALLMAISSLIAILVWFIDSKANTSKIEELDERLTNEEEWYEGDNEEI